MNKLLYRMLPVLLVGASMVACTKAPTPEAASNVPNTTTVSPSQETTVPVVAVTYESDDEFTDWQNGSVTKVELAGASASVNGMGAAANGSTITILSPGVYVVSGKLSDGQIIVDAQNKGTVRLVLNGAEIHSNNSAPIWVKNASKTIVTLADGTQNIVSDGAGSRAQAGEDEPSAAIFSKDDLTFNGTGTLVVQGEYKDGIASKDEMVITGGKIEVSAKDDGLVARDMLAVKDGQITIQAAGDGIKTTNDTDASKGFIALEGGTFAINAGADGIQAETSVQVSGGTFKIVTNGGSVNSSKTASAAAANPKGMGAAKSTPAAAAADTASAKGIKAAVDITISGGTFELDTADDAIHSNDSITVAGGQIAIASGDDGIHADARLTIKGGKTTVAKSYEGIESKLITIAGGETRVTSLDDGVNVGGGNDSSSMNGRPGQNTFASAGDSGLFVDGGYVAVSATGDGVDVNGSIRMTNGTIVVSGPTASNNGALDYDGTFEMTGGFVIAAGSAGMAQAPSEQSTQHAVAMMFSSTQQAGTLVSLHDAQGNAVVTYTPSKPFQSVVISSPNVKKGETYTLYTGGTASGNVSDGLYTDGVHKDGTKVVSFAITNVVTWLSESGVTTGSPNTFGGPKRR